MSQEELLVTLGVKDKGATSQIRALKNELKYLDSQYKLTASGSKNFEQTSEGLRTKMDYLNKKIEATKTKLQVYKTQMQQAKQSIDQKKDALERLKNAEGDNSAAIKKTEEELNKYKAKLAEATRNVNLTETELKNLEAELQATNNAFNSLAITNYQAKMAALSAQLKNTGAALTTFGTSMSTLGSKMMALATPIIAFTAAAVKSSIDFESAWTGVLKTVDASESDLANLREEILEMSKVMPESVTEIAGVAELAGQLGIKTENIEGFTKAMVMLGDSTTLSSEEAASALAKYANVTNMSQDNFDRLGATIVDLGNNFATTETDIVNMATRLAGAGSQIGLSQGEIMGFATALSSVGIEAEMGGSAFSKAMIKMQVACETGLDKVNALTEKTGMSLRDLQLLSANNSKDFKALAQDLGLTADELDNMIESGANLEHFAEIAGVSAQDFKKAFEEDAASAITMFIKGLGDVEGKGESTIQMLQDMGFTEVRLRDTMTRMANASELCTGAIEMGNKAWNENTALTNEAEKRYATMQSKIEMLKNKFKAMGIELGDKLLPFVSELADKLENLINWFGGLSDETQKNILKFGAYTFGIGAALKVTGKFTSDVGKLVSTGAKLTNFMSSSTLVTKALGKGLSATAGTAGVLKAGVGALAKAFLPLEVGVLAAGTAIYAVKEHSKAMNNTVLKSSEEMGILERAFTKMSGQTVYTRKELEQMGLAQEKLSDTMSNEFKDAVNKATSNVQNFNFELKKIRIDGVITTEEIDGLKSRVDELCNSAISTIDSKCSEIQKSLGKAFNSDGVLDDDETKILEYYANWGDKNKAEVTRMQGEINEILRKVRDEGYVLTSDDEAKIKNYYAEIQRIELEFQASNNEEILFEKNKFLNRANNLDAESASKMLKERRKYYEEERAEKLAQYDTLINDLSEKLDTMDGETRESAERVIESYREQKQEQSEILQKYYNEEYEALINQNKNLEGEIDRYSGEILSREDKLNAEKLENLMSHYAGINQITESGMTRLYNTTTQAYENVYVCVDEVTGKIVGLTTFYANETNISADQVTGATKRIENSMDGLSQSAQNDYNTISRALTDTKNTHIDSSNQIVDADGRVVGSLKEVQTTFGGVKSGIIDINGTPVKIYVDKDGVITNANQIREALNEAARDRTATITVVTKGDSTFLKDKKGNYLQVDGYASGTENATRGVHLVGEKGPELVFFDGGEKVLNALNTRNLLSNGGYFNKNTVESTTLYNNYNNSRSNITYNNGVNAEELSSTIIASVIAAVKNINISLDINKTAKTIDNITGNEGALSRRLNGC